MSAFFLYSQAMRDTVKQDNPDASFGQVVSQSYENALLRKILLFCFVSCCFHVLWYECEYDAIVVISGYCLCEWVLSLWVLRCTDPLVLCEPVTQVVFCIAIPPRWPHRGEHREALLRGVRECKIMIFCTRSTSSTCLLVWNRNFTWYESIGTCSTGLKQSSVAP